MIILPSLPLSSWQESKRTLHLYLQIVGKVRLALHPKLNHWWHVTLYPSARGLSTQAIPVAGGVIELEFDFVDHLFTVRSSNQSLQQLPLRDGLSVAEFFRGVMASLERLRVRPSLLARPAPMTQRWSAATFPLPQTLATTTTTPRRSGAFGRFSRGRTGYLQPFGDALTVKAHPSNCSGTR